MNFGLIHICLESIEIGFNDENHCITETTTCCGNKNEEEKDCDSCFDIDVDNKVDISTLSAVYKFDLDLLIIETLIFSNNVPLNIEAQIIENLANPPPGLHDLSTYLSKSFLRGPTSYLV